MKNKKIITALVLSMGLTIPNIAHASSLNNVKNETQIVYDFNKNKDSVKSVEVPSIMIEKEIEDTKENLREGKTIGLDNRLKKLRVLIEKHKSKIDAKTYLEAEGLIFKYKKIQKNIDMLDGVLKDIEDKNFEDSLKSFHSIEGVSKEAVYQGKVKEIKEVLAEKLAKENREQEIKALKESLEQLDDSDYQKAKEYLDNFVERELDNNKDEVEYLYEYVDQMEVRENDNYVANNPAPAQAPVQSNNQTYTYSYNIYKESLSGVIESAYNQLGKPYVWGAGGANAFDCSGLTSYLYGQVGIGLPHNAQQQSYVGYEVDDIQQGDLLFFGGSRNNITHVGIYVGEGKMIHAANPGRGVVLDNVGSPWYSSRIVSVRRIVE